MMEEIVEKLKLATPYLAWWGAILSSVLAFLEWTKFYRDKPDVRIKVQDNMGIMKKFNDDSFIIIRAYNKGRRPVTLGFAGLYLPGGKSAIANPLAQPAMGGASEIGEGKSAQFVINQNEFEKRFKCKARDCVGFATDQTDQTDQIYYSDGLIMRILKLKRMVL